MTEPNDTPQPEKEEPASAETTPRKHPRDPLHGVTLETIVRFLQEKHGWEEMGNRVRVRCFQENPSIKSSLTFLRKTPWAREKIENWYVWENRNRRRD